MIILRKSLSSLTGMTLEEIFNSIKPVLDCYITEKHELEKRISQEDTLPDEVIAECPIHDIVKVEKFDKKTILGKYLIALIRIIHLNKLL